MGKKIDYTGQKFNRLTILKRDQSKKDPKHSWWICQCECGTITKGIRIDKMKSGHTKSCGCLQKQKSSNDLTNKKFGKLTAIKPTSQRKWGYIVWECQCECGKIVYIDSGDLVNNKTFSCGCQNESKGQYKIRSLLMENHIYFEKQKKFDSCIFSDTNNKAKFDFYVDNKYLIEYDGVQHFKEGGLSSKWHNLKYYQNHDNVKNKWCKQNNIPLIRIPYTHYDNLCIDDLLLEKSNFVVSC